MEQKKIIRTGILLILLVAAAAMVAVGVILIARRGSGDPGKENETVETINPGYNADFTFDKTAFQTVVNDRLRIGDGDSEASHALSLSGAVGAERVETLTGTRSETFDAISFRGKGAAAEWVMDLGNGGSSELIMLEIEEVHRDDLKAFAYTVFVDGKETYFRTYEGISSSPNHYFIAVRRADVADPSHMTVRIVSGTGNVFSISEVMAYTDFFEKLSQVGVDSSLMLYLQSGDSADTAKKHIADFSGSDFENFKLGLMFKLNYMSYVDSQIADFIASFLSLAGENNMPLQLMPSLSWSAPYDVPDGLGGSFTDVKYGQVLYNSLTGEWVDSTPNAYGNTQWCSWGDPVLLKAQRARILSSWDRVTEYLYGAMAAGRFSGDVSTLIEHSVVYKGPLPQAKFYTMGLIDGGDFNPVVIAAAKADGVTLDPTDGLSYEEKKWMNEYQAKYVQALADFYQEGYGSEPILVQNGTVTYPTKQMANELYSHTVQWVDQTPSHGDLRISGWKSGIGNGFYEAGEEFALIDDIRFYQYRVAYGKTGYCNFEMSSLHEPETFRQTLSKVYEAGVNFVTLFNDETDYQTPSMLAEIDGSLPDEAATAPVHYDESLLWVDYNRDAAMTDLLTEAKGVLSSRGVRIDTSNGALLSSTVSGDRYITYAVSDGEPWENGIYLELEAYQIGAGSIEVYAGASEDSLASVGAFRYDRGQSNSFNRYSIQVFDLKEATKGLSSYVVRLVFGGADVSLAQVKAVTIRKAYGDVTGQKNGVTFTKEQIRLENLWISSREEAQRMEEAYVAKNGGANAVSEAIETLNDMGQPREAVKLASEHISRLLPATFAVKGDGPLGTLPISVKLAANTTTATVVINELTGRSAAFELYSTYQFNDNYRTARMTFTGLEAGRYRLDETGWNAFALVYDENGTYETDADGNLAIRVTASYEKTKPMTTVSGRVNQYGNGVLRLIVQDPSISDYNRYLEIQVGTTCEYTRRADGETETTDSRPSVGDYVTLTFAEDGATLVSCEAVYGQKTGVIRSFTPPDSTDAATSNGLITLEDGTTYELEYQAYTTSISFDGEKAYYARSMTTEDMLRVFRPGQTITVTYCPEYYGSYQRLISIVG